MPESRLPALFRIIALLLLSLALPNTGAQVPATAGDASLDAYAYGLTEQLIEQGRAQLLRGEFDLAERSLLHALQVTKVNHGLYSSHQVSVLELLVHTQLSQQNWDAADEHIGYFEWLNRRLARHDLGAYLQGTRVLSDLLLQASADPANAMSVRHLVQSRNLNWQAVTAIENTLGADSLELAPWLYRVALAHYYQSTLIRRRHLSNYIFKSDSDEVVSGWSLSANETMSMSYRIGRELLQRIERLYNAANSLPSEAAALAAVYQGDWEWLYDRRRQALAYYRQAQERLGAADLDQAEVDRFFNRPVLLPQPGLRTNWQSALAESPAQPLQFVAWSRLYPGAPAPQAHLPRDLSQAPRARVRFDLLPAGEESGDGTGPSLHLSGLQIVSITPDDELARQQALRDISLLRFRPPMLAGERAAVTNVELDYLFPPEQGPASAE